MHICIHKISYIVKTPNYIYWDGRNNVGPDQDLNSGRWNL